MVRASFKSGTIARDTGPEATLFQLNSLKSHGKVYTLRQRTQVQCTKEFKHDPLTIGARSNLLLCYVNKYIEVNPWV